LTAVTVVIKNIFPKIWIPLLVLLTSCSNVRYLPEGETLFDGSRITINDTAYSASFKKNMRQELQEAVRPKRNKKFAGMRIRLSIYNWVGTPKKDKSWRTWVREKLGEPPVYGSAFHPQYSQDVLHNFLQNQGFFNNQVLAEKTVRKKISKGEFNVWLGAQYHYKNIDFTAFDSTRIARDIEASGVRSYLKPGNPYDLEIIKAERDRINTELKNKGYYFFSPDYLILYADTAAGNHEVNAKMRLRYDIMPQSAYKRYRIRKIEVNPAYRFSVNMNNRTPTRRADHDDTVHYENLEIIQRRKMYRPQIFRESILFDSASIYSLKTQNASLNRLINLGTFKFVKNEFIPIEDSVMSNLRLSSFSAPYAFLKSKGLMDNMGNELDVRYLLTPQANRQMNAELGAFTQNDSRAGSKASVSWRNRNLFKGAEVLSVKINGGFEVQYGGQSKLPNTYNLGTDLSLNFPRFIVPFVKVRGSSAFVPRTLANLGYNFYLRNGLYMIHSFNTGFGYNWKEELRKDHKLFPFNITYVKIDTFSAINNNDYNLSNLLFNGVIFGPTYEYTFNSQADNNNKKNNYYFNGVADFSGNIVGLVQGTSIDKTPKEIFNSKYAQYLKFTVDGRYYRALNKDRTQNLAARFYAGFGYAYGNSYNLPNVKQYFSGGSSSLRGFQSRLVGPGTFNERYLNDSTTFIEMLGDIKLEANLEYRLKLYQFLHGAVFADAGNVWLLRDNPDFPGGKFSKSFMKELAVDGGIGLRLDFNILLLRLDFGIPFRKPWLPEGQRWVFNDMRFGDPDWRRENFIFSLAIGYPF